MRRGAGPSSPHYARPRGLGAGVELEGGSVLSSRAELEGLARASVPVDHVAGVEMLLVEAPLALVLRSLLRAKRFSIITRMRISVSSEVKGLALLRRRSIGLDYHGLWFGAL